ncbi:hypothetical protein KSP39_PZI000147 [Platanthera zijinensis]|uniref:Uncharacterized protein n=1 Tax=Platanthera zijinensis TaxID=2320716 RepID=A0AAP0C3G3_9ASPA
MGEKLRGKEKMSNEAEAFPLVDTLLARLNDFDLRLRQLEEKPMLSSESHFAAELRPRRKQRASSKDGDQHLKGVLLDRLNLLENRIRQLGRDLDGGAGREEEITAAGGSRTENRQLALSCGEEASWAWRAGEDIFQARVSNKKSRDSTPAATTEAAKKRIGSWRCRAGKRRAGRGERGRTSFRRGCRIRRCVLYRC